MLHPLTDNPGRKQLLLADLPGRMPGTVEETLCHATPGTWMRRNVTRNTTGVSVRGSRGGPVARRPVRPVSGRSGACQRGLAR
ncbi:hypothetical protein JG491_38225 [Streptomyces sp. CRPSP2-6A1]|uniref:hypothetical protein n=1 Tax=Streptomyces sp. CRPSP2-6A1 TaxID=2799588 RepID=UPI0018F0FE11|nr:hypothetical protein [Streptomyces sp. CRPSP2-6A1]MBJ7005783.1 hypothetical protein [Streptomyces sp. CRPSP2-6A1]